MCVLEFRPCLRGDSGVMEEGRKNCMLEVFSSSATFLLGLFNIILYQTSHHSAMISYLECTARYISQLLAFEKDFGVCPLN